MNVNVLTILACCVVEAVLVLSSAYFYCGIISFDIPTFTYHAFANLPFVSFFLLEKIFAWMQVNNAIKNKK